MAEKYRFAECILYPQNMVSNWKLIIDDVLQCPYVYVIHDRDLEKDGSPVKVHIHLILVHNNTVQLSWFIKWVNRLSDPDKFVIDDYGNILKDIHGLPMHVKACSTAQPIINFKRAYDYLIHNTDKARAEGKYQYNSSAYVCGNNFDIHHYIQIDENQKLAITQAIDDRICKFKIMDLVDIREWVIQQGDEYYQVFVGKSSYFERLCSGNWKRWEREKQKEKK